MDFYIKRIIAGAVGFVGLILGAMIASLLGGEIMHILTWGIILGVIVSIITYFAIDWKYS